MFEPNFSQQKNEEAQNFGDDETSELCQTLLSVKQSNQPTDDPKNSTKPNNTNTDDDTSEKKENIEIKQLKKEKTQEKTDNEEKSENANEQNSIKDFIKRIIDLAPENNPKGNENDDAIHKEENSLSSLPIFDTNDAGNHSMYIGLSSHGDERDESIRNFVEKSYTADDTRSDTNKVPWREKLNDLNSSL